jgi:hypothetical protein
VGGSGAGEELEDVGPSEARRELLRDGTGSDDEVDELGLLVGPEAAMTERKPGTAAKVRRIQQRLWRA